MQRMLALLYLIIVTTMAFGQEQVVDKQELNKQLIEAINEKSIELVTATLAEGADPNFYDKYDCDSQPLRQAVWSRDYAILKLLLENKANPNVECDSMEMPILTIAIMIKRIDMVELLLEYGADPNYGYNSNGEGRYSNCNTPLNEAFGTDDVSIVKLLLEKGADPHGGYDSNCCGETSTLDLACDTNNPEIVRVILEKFSVNKKDSKILKRALSRVCLKGSSTATSKIEVPNLKAIAHLLYTKIVGKGQNNLFLLILAIQFDDEDMFRQALDKVTNINAVDSNKFSPLVHALLKRSIKYVTYLLDKGADPTMKRCDTMTPLDFLILDYDGFLEIPLALILNDRKALAKLLLDNGARVDEFISLDGGRYHNVFHRAIKNKDAPIIEALLEDGADVDMQNPKGKSALDIAAKVNLGQEYPEIMEAMLKKSKKIDQDDIKDNR